MAATLNRECVPRKVRDMSRLFTGATARRITVALAGVGVASAIATGGVANAAPAPHEAKPAPAQTTPVPGTKCTLAGVEKALAKEDPALWKEIQSHPRAKEHFENTIVLTPAQRKQQREEMRKKHPERAEIKNFLRDHGIAKKDRSAHRAAIKKALETCSG